MCKGDDPTCAEFEVHHRQFQEDMARERRAFLASAFAGGSRAFALSVVPGLLLVAAAAWAGALLVPATR